MFSLCWRYHTYCGYINKVNTECNKMRKRSVYSKCWAYFADSVCNNKPSERRRKNFYFQQRMETLIITLVFFGCFCDVSSYTQTISIGFSIPYTVLLFDIVGISQGYITRTIRSAYPQSDLPNLNIEGLTNSASSPTIPPTKHVLKEETQHHQHSFIPGLASYCQNFKEARTCTSEKDVCLLANYSKFQLPNKGGQTVVSIGKILLIIYYRQI